MGTDRRENTSKRRKSEQEKRQGDAECALLYADVVDSFSSR